MVLECVQKPIFSSDSVLNCNSNNNSDNNNNNNINNRMYDKILDRDWSSARLFVT